MYSESSKLERPSHRLLLDSFHDAEGLPIPHSFDSHPERPKIVIGDEDDYDPHTTTFASPDIDQKISHHILVEESKDLIRPNTPGYDFYSSPPVSSTYEPGDMSLSPAAMFLSSFSPSSTPQRLPDAEGELISGYKLGPVIGYGGFSTIRRASSTSGGTVAVKIVRHSDIAKQADPALIRKRLSNEASIWSSLSHEHILPLFSTVHTSYADFFVTLYCPAGSLFDILKRDGRPALMQDDAGMMFRQVVRGLRYLHEVARLVHRDIKLENVLVDEMGVCRIGDFGMTRNIGDLDADEDDLLEMQQLEGQHHLGGERRATFAESKRQTKPGLPVHLSMIRHHSGPRHRKSTPADPSSTPAKPAHNFQPGSLPYAAPELLMPHFSTPVRVNPAQDIWALGVMLYAMLTGRLPFVDSFEPRLQMKILHGTYDVPQGIGQGAELVLQGCLDRSASSRWSIAMVDEVAWDVGWSVEEPASVSEDEMNETRNRSHRSTSRSHSRSRSRCRIETSGSGFGSGSTPSMDAARRRSTSRARRSQSRASMLTDRSRTASRSASRPSRRSPPHSALADSIHSATSSNFSVPYDRHHESALSTSLFLERGRRANKVDDIRSASRSPCPSVVPATPTDFVGGHDLPPLDDVVEAETSRGRKAFIRPVLTPRPADPYAREESDEADESPRWISDHRKGGGLFSGLSRRLNPLAYLRDESKGRDRSGNIIRAGSTPPTNEDATSLRFPDSQGVGGFLREGSLSLGVPVSNAVRSRSTGYEGVRH